jgi:hypothetical protein
MDKYRASELEKTSLGLSRTLVFESSSLLWLSHKIDPNIVGTQGDDELKCENFGKHVSRSFMFIENIKSEKTSIFVGECDFFKSIWQFEPWNIEPDQLWDFKNCRPMPVPD